MKNIEIKFHISSLSEIHSFLQSHPDVHFQWKKEQIDFYFSVNRGRLKLRLQTDSKAQLIYYQRDDDETARMSEYLIYSSENSESLQNLLKKALGMRCVVRKKRALYQFKNVRIHLDEVENLGNFLECEAVLSDTVDEETSRKNLAELLTYLSSFSMKPVAQSYADLARRTASEKKFYPKIKRTDFQFQTETNEKMGK